MELYIGRRRESVLIVDGRESLLIVKVRGICLRINVKELRLSSLKRKSVKDWS